MAEPKERVEGKFSVTQLIAPTRISYLRMVNDLYVSPKSLIKSFYGKAFHSTTGSAFGCAEVLVEDDQCSGTFDLFDEGVLIDYKVWGSYRVARALGLHSIKVINPVTKRPNTRWVPGGEPEIQEETLQLNRYRMLLHQRFPDLIQHSMKLFVIVKDAELQTAFSRGVTEPYYWIDIPQWDDINIWSWFEDKRLSLERAMETKTTACCDSVENWNGNRCKYCDVAEFCNVGQAQIRIDADAESIAS
jgi:hypothetical protein